MNREITKLGKFRSINCYRRAVATESVFERHRKVSRHMEQVDTPLGWGHATVPPAPDFGKEIYAGYSVVYKNKRLRCDGGYAYRDAEYLNLGVHEDHLFFRFDSRDPEIDYKRILHANAPQVIEAFISNRAEVCFLIYGVLYQQRYEELLSDGRTNLATDVVGRNNILTLEAANYWNAELCQHIFGFGRDEVIRRLKGKVPRAESLMDGVYVVFSDNPDLTFEEYCAYNDALKPVLGLA